MLSTPLSWHFLTLRNSSFCNILFFMHACIAYCIGQTRTNISRASQCSNFLPELYTGCPNKHGNSVTNSISSFQIILWISIVIPTEKAVICKIFVCYVYNLFVYVRLHTVVLSKTRKLQYTNRVNLSVFTVHLADTL